MTPYSEAAALFDSAAIEERTADKIPDGKYKGEVVDFRCFQAKDQRIYVSWWIKVLVPRAHGGKLVENFRQLRSGPSAAYLRAEIARVIGRTPVFADLLTPAGTPGPAKAAIVGSKVEFEQSTVRSGSNEYVNISVTGLISPAPKSQDEPTAEQPAALPSEPGADWDEDEIPF